MTPFPFDDQIKTAADLLVRARVFYDVWWVLKSSSDNKALQAGMNRFWDFFRLDIHANFVACVVTTAAVLKRDTDTINVPALVKASKKLIKRTVYEEAERQVAALAPTTEKVLILRNCLFAHRSRTVGYEDAFGSASLEPIELRQALERGLSIMNTLLKQHGLRDRHFYECSPEEAKELLTAIALQPKTPS